MEMSVLTQTCCRDGDPRKSRRLELHGWDGGEHGRSMVLVLHAQAIVCYEAV